MFIHKRLFSPHFMLNAHFSPCYLLWLYHAQKYLEDGWNHHLPIAKDYLHWHLVKYHLGLQKINKWSFSLKALSSSISDPSAMRIVLPLLPNFFSALTEFETVSMYYIIMGIPPSFIHTSINWHRARVEKLNFVGND